MFSSNPWGPTPVPQQGQPFQDQYRARIGALQQFQAQRYEIIRVNGENGAQAFQMAPNSSALIWRSARFLMRKILTIHVSMGLRLSGIWRLSAWLRGSLRSR